LRYGPVCCRVIESQRLTTRDATHEIEELFDPPVRPSARCCKALSAGAAGADRPSAIGPGTDQIGRAVSPTWAIAMKASWPIRLRDRRGPNSSRASSSVAGQWIKTTGNTGFRQSGRVEQQMAGAIVLIPPTSSWRSWVRRARDVRARCGKKVRSTTDSRSGRYSADTCCVWLAIALALKPLASMAAAHFAPARPKSLHIRC